MSTYNPLFKTIKKLKEIIHDSGTMGYKMLLPNFEEEEYIEKQVENMESNLNPASLLSDEK